jgi:hypothetical protein
MCNEQGAEYISKYSNPGLGIRFAYGPDTFRPNIERIERG